MPAIQPARLKKHASELAEYYTEPDLFVRKLHSLMDLYTDHTHRKGQAGEPSPLVRAYNTPPPVMRQVLQELIPLVRQHPAEVLPLYDALWAELNFDFRLMAARLLGMLPVDPPDPVIDRLDRWVRQGLETRLLEDIFEAGFATLIHVNPEALLDLVASWMETPDLETKQAGLRALKTLVGHLGAEKSPTIYRLITPFLRIAPFQLRPDILKVLSTLAHISPSETAYTLRQNLSAPNNPDTPWIIRQVLDEFPDDSRISLRMALKANG